MVKKIRLGIDLSLKNALSLFDDGELLYANKRIPRAYTMFHFSLEEVGRFHMLLGIYLGVLTGRIKKSDANFRLLKSKGYENHLIKLEKSLSFSLAISKELIKKTGGNIKINEAEYLYEKMKNKIKDFNIMKNKSLYVNFQNNSFVLPEDNVSTTRVEEIKDLAEIGIVLSKNVLNALEKEGM